MSGHQKPIFLSMKNFPKTDIKVDVEEASINFVCVKEELTNFQENKNKNVYEITSEESNLGETSHKNIEEYGNNVINVSGSHVAMESTSIKLEDIKEESSNFDSFHCSNCNGNYKGYCLKCSTLSRILNRSESLSNLELESNTTPKDIVEIRDSLMGKCVYLLETIPKSVIFGPFDGISGIKTTDRFSWKIQDRKLVDIQNGNWMKNIACTTNSSSKNLNIFQCDSNLYFRTNREIMEGEELLIYYDDEEIQTSDSEGSYFIPSEVEKLPKIFACTLCCLGFSLNKCLMEHKSKCPYAEHDGNITDFELIECDYCKMWLQKQEYETYHMANCCDKKERTLVDHPKASIKSEVQIEEIIKDKIEFVDVNKLSETGNYSVECQGVTCSEANPKNSFQIHLDASESTIKPFECGSCAKKFLRKVNLKAHIINKHAAPGTAKKHQCSQCSYQTNHKRALQKHLDSHAGIKPFECGVCMMKFTAKSSMNKHMKHKHSEPGTAKDYKCPKCPYQTYNKSYLQEHLNAHSAIRPFRCDTCSKEFSYKSNFTKHVQVKHSFEKDYKCSECSYQTSYKNCFEGHINMHNDVKPFECDLCKMKFSQKSTLNSHMKAKHLKFGNTNAYECSECIYRTDRNSHFENHLNTHYGIKPFQCDICTMKFSMKANLKSHIKNVHAKIDTKKDYECSECSFQTNYKEVFRRHVNNHRGVVFV